MFVECNTDEFSELTSGTKYLVQELGENSFKINGRWYGQGNFILQLGFQAVRNKTATCFN